MTMNTGYENMSDREALDKALYNDSYGLGPGWTTQDIIRTAARKQLALMPEKCEHGNSGEHWVPVFELPPGVNNAICSGKVYSQETTKVVKRSLLSVAGEVASDGSFWCPNIDQAVVVVLNALGELE